MILSSREQDISIAAELEEFLFCIYGTLGYGELKLPLPKTEHELMVALDQALLELIVEYDELQKTHSASISVLERFTIANHDLSRNLKKAADMLQALVQPVNDEAVLELALDALKIDGNTIMDPTSGRISFAPDDLREGLRTAIEMYNAELTSKMLD